jgi:hypothetical protein
MVKNVMLNLFQHLMETITYETLKRVQGDKKGITTQSPKGGGDMFGEILDMFGANLDIRS